jgi:hypothetical protein
VKQDASTQMVAKVKQFIKECVWRIQPPKSAVLRVVATCSSTKEHVAVIMAAKHCARLRLGVSIMLRKNHYFAASTDQEVKEQRVSSMPNVKNR